MNAHRLMLALIACGAFSQCAFAGDTSASANQTTSGSAIGTTIMGEQESAVGLYLMPWQGEAPIETDRPPALVSEPLQAIDSAQFDARVQTSQTIAAFRRSSLPRN